MHSETLKAKNGRYFLPHLTKYEEVVKKLAPPKHSFIDVSFY
jgi:hypothetical protein